MTYRVAGMLTEVKHMITAKSRLCSAVLDELHRGGIEIVSPSFMNQRILAENVQFIPAATPRGGARSQSQAAPEKLVFDKAEEAETIEALRQRRTHVVQQIDDLTARLKEAEPEAKNKIERELNRLESTAATLKRVIELREQRSTDD